MSWSSDDDQAPSLGHMSIEEETEAQSEIDAVDKIMAIEDLNLDNNDGDDTEALLDGLYPAYQPIFPLDLLSMELVFEIGRHLEKPDLARFLISDKTVARHPRCPSPIVATEERETHTAVGIRTMGVLAKVAVSQGSREGHPRRRR